MQGDVCPVWNDLRAYIDEQLIPFRGRCSFQQYLPSKLDRYRLKLFLIVDCSTGFFCDGIPYIGKVWRKLLWANCANVSTTQEKNNSDRSKQFSDPKNRPVDSTLFGFDQNTTLVSYIPKKEQVCCASFNYASRQENRRRHKKPDIVLFYNSTKGAVDTVEQLCNSYSPQRQTKRWPLAYFMNILNLACINGFMLFRLHNAQYVSNMSFKRRKFLQDLGFALVKPLISNRARSFRAWLYLFKRPLFSRGVAGKVGILQESKVNRSDEKSKRKRCYRCIEDYRDRKSSRVCKKCNHCVCASHSSKMESLWFLMCLKNNQVRKQ